MSTNSDSPQGTGRADYRDRGATLLEMDVFLNGSASFFINFQMLHLVPNKPFLTIHKNDCVLLSLRISLFLR